MRSKRKKQLLTILDNISGIAELRSILGFQEEAANFRERLADNEFRIAVVGEFSSGKSTFINAMLGRDILKHATTETTAAITRIVNVPKDDPRRMSGRVFFTNGTQTAMADLSDLKEFTTTQSKRYLDRVPEEIDFVEVYIPFITISRPVVLVDTPGLNGTAEGHREKTVDLIQKAHACIYLIPRSGLGESDILFLSLLTRFQKNYIFIQNFTDELNDDEGDSIAAKLAEQSAILGKKVFSDAQDCSYEVCGISALMELASTDNSIERLYADSLNTLTPKDRVDLHNKSGFEHFREILAHNFREDRIDDIQYGGTARALASWIRFLSQDVALREQQACEFFEASEDKRAMERLERKLDNMLSASNRQREDLQNFILVNADTIRREECEVLKQKLEELVGQLSERMNVIRDAASLDNFEKNLPGLLENMVYNLLSDINVMLRRKFQTFYQILMVKTDQYTGIKSTDTPYLEVFIPEHDQTSSTPFAPAQSRIDKWKDDLRGRRDESLVLEQKDAELSERIRDEQGKENSVKRAQNELTAQRNREIGAMGSRPKATPHEVQYTEYVPHGGLGILDFFFGEKKVTRYRTEYDDSAGKQWDREKARIQNAYVERNSALTTELAAAERRKSDLLIRKDANQEKLRSVEEKIRNLEELIELETNKVETEKKLAAQEYMKLRRASLLNQINKYLLGASSVLTVQTESIKEAAEKNAESYTKLAIERYNNNLQQKRQWLEQMKQQKCPEIKRQAQKLSDIRRDLQKMLNELEHE